MTFIQIPITPNYYLYVNKTDNNAVIVYKTARNAKNKKNKLKKQTPTPLFQKN